MILVAGQGTDVGKTVVSAIFATIFKADYWKPVQCGAGADADSETMRTLIGPGTQQIHPPAYSFPHSLSPHHAARLEQVQIDPKRITPPKTERPLIIEMAGGFLVPLTRDFLNADLFQHWPVEWVLVSKHYIGSINHTLLTLEAMQRRQIPLAGILFNGTPNPDSEAVILQYAKAPLLGRLLQENQINHQTIQRYADSWMHNKCPFFQI
jgi:dethiobiotin synthetase